MWKRRNLWWKIVRTSTLNLPQQLSAAFYSSSKYSERAVQLWHRRLGHLNRQDLIRLQNTPKQALTRPLCEFCKTGKTKQKPSRRPQDTVFEKKTELRIASTVMDSGWRVLLYSLIRFHFLLPYVFNTYWKWTSSKYDLRHGSRGPLGHR